MKGIIYMDNGSKIVIEIFKLPHPRRCETWAAFERRLVRNFNMRQPSMVHKVVRMKLMRN